MVFLSDTDPDYLAEILDYTETAEHDDCPDSLASLIRIHKKKGRNWKDVVFLSDTDPDYLAEILDYTETAEHDDCPDSLASLIRIHKKKGRVHTIEGGI